ncbi:hypothetical protein QYE76_051581 [Lolium multiflorum]|uniref:Uncharacterized protein n=1 Tax=Lolium multiflorum TaxID=4521 RepID=A0AAD8STN5_LOLMU|nr:hypothetical protein QYE76_051581 [Lolium multiflorum]
MPSLKVSSVAPPCSSRRPPAGRFRKENVGVMASRIAVSKPWMGTAPVPMPTTPAALADVVSDFLPPTAGGCDVPAAEAPPVLTLMSADLAAASPSLHFGGAVATGSWVSFAGDDDGSDEEELAPMTPPATSNSSLASDPAVLVEGLGSLSLSLSPAALGGPAEVPLSDDVLPAPSLLWVDSLGSDEDDDDEELAPRSPLAGSVHVEEAPVAPCSGLGDDDDWVQVGRGGRPSRDPSSLLRKEGLERSLAFKRWARGRCFRCLEHDHQFIMIIWQYPSRKKLIKTLHKLIPTEVDSAKKHTPYSRDQDDLRDGTLSKAGSSQSEASYPSLDSGDHDGLRERLLSKLRLSLKEGDVDLLEELFVLEGIIFDPDSVVLDIDWACHDATSRQIASLVQAVDKLTETVQELTDENETLRHQLEVAQEIAARAQCAATDWSGGLLFGFVPAAVLRLVGFMPD